MKRSVLVDYDYAQQARKPDWFDGRHAIELAATSGSSPFNEWAGFDSREDAISVLLNTGSVKQSFIDRFEQIGDEVYYKDEVETAMENLGFVFEDGDWSEFAAAHEAEIIALVKPADLKDIFFAMSRF